MPGASIDLRTGWDLSNPQHRMMVIDMVNKERPLFIIGSPPCTKFSRLQNLNGRWRGPEDWQRFWSDWKQAVKHVEFCTFLYHLQVRAGRYYIHEHPWSASSWELPCIRRLLQQLETKLTYTDQCQFGQVTVDDQGRTWPVRKPTGFMSNSRFVAEELCQVCAGGH